MMEKALLRLDGDPTDVVAGKSVGCSDPNETNFLLSDSFCENYVAFWLYNCRNCGVEAGSKVQNYSSEVGQVFLLQLYSNHQHCGSLCRLCNRRI